MIRLMIVDDEKLIREGLKILLSNYEDINVIGLCSDGEEAYKMCHENDVDIVLMDIRMEKCDGVMGTKLIQSLNKEIKILVLTTFKDDEYIFSALSYGANGYLLKDSSSERIYEGIKSVYQGNIVVDPEIADKLLDMRNPKQSNQAIIQKYKLTEKEVEIIKLIAEGMTNEEISQELFLAIGTIKNNISLILSKLSLRDRTQLAIFAHKHRMLK